MSITATLLTLITATVLALGACSRGGSLSAPPATSASPTSAPAGERVVGPLTPSDAAALAVMTERLKEYVALHVRLEQTLPPMSVNSTPEEIDANQRAFEKLLRDARPTAKQGDIFTPDAQPVIKRLLAAVFGGPDGRLVKASIMDENTIDPVTLRLTVNRRYPDTVPLATIPPQILQTLPLLSEDLEYRFIGDWLILLDSHAHVIADLIDNALPK
jgi:hypothetical protein